MPIPTPREPQDDSATPKTPEAMSHDSMAARPGSRSTSCTKPVVEGLGRASSETFEPAFEVGFTREEAAQALGISTQSLDRLVERGLLRPSRALRRPLFSKRELERFLAETA